jgi:hypothetical protein
MRTLIATLALTLAALTSGCVIQVDDSNEFGGGSFLSPYVGVETHPYTPGEDWAGWAKVRYKVTHTTCPRENRGEWIDGAFGWVEINGNDVMLGFDGFPPLEGTLAQKTAAQRIPTLDPTATTSAAKLSGEMMFMANDEQTRCVVGGDVTMSGNEMGGEIEEELSGGLECVTRGSYSVVLPRNQ